MCKVEESGKNNPKIPKQSFTPEIADKRVNKKVGNSDKEGSQGRVKQQSQIERIVKGKNEEGGEGQLQRAYQEKEKLSFYSKLPEGQLVFY